MLQSMEDETPVEVTRDLVPEDRIAFNVLALEKSSTYRRAIRNNRIMGIVFLGAIFGGCFSLSLPYVPPWFAAATSLFAFGVAVVVSEGLNATVRKRRLRKVALESLTPQILARSTYNFTPEGFTWESPYGRGESTWKVVDDVVETDDCLYLFEGTQKAHIFPKRSFESPGQIHDFLQLAHRYVSVSPKTLH